MCYYFIFLKGQCLEIFMLAYLVVLSFLKPINVYGVGFSISVFFKERKKERIFISQPQHDRYYMIYSEHSKQLLASERKKYIIVLFTDKTGLRGTAVCLTLIFLVFKGTVT